MRCPRCGSRVLGGGYTNLGKTFCCRACALRTVCLCREKQRARTDRD